MPFRGIPFGVGESVRFAVFLDLVAFPLGALGKDDQGVVAGIMTLVGDQQVDQLGQLDLVFGDAAAERGDVGGVERGIAGVAPEDAEDADAFVGATVVRWRSMVSVVRPT